MPTHKPQILINTVKMKIFNKPLIAITLGLIIFNTGCSSNPSVSQTENTLGIARVNAEKKLVDHIGQFPYGPGTYIARSETFYDVNNKPKLYEFVLMKDSEDVGSFFGDVYTGEVSPGGLYKSMSYEMDKYYYDLLEPTIQMLNLQVIEKRRVSAGMDGNSWMIRFAQPLSDRPAIEFVTVCSTSKRDGWFEFRKGKRAPICEQPFQG